MTGMRRIRSCLKRSFTVLAIMVALSMAILVLDPLFRNGTSGEAEALRPVSLAISLYPRGDDGNVVEILTGPGTTGRESVRGKVDLFRSARALRTRVLANLYFESTRPDLVRGSVFPPVLDFDPISKFNHTDIIFNFQLNSPMLNYSSAIGGLIKVRVWGDWFTPFSQGVESWSAGTIEEFYIYVNIKPFHYLDLMFDPPMVQIRPGEPAELEVIVRNRGNGMERVELMIPNEATYARSGWAFQLERTVIDIPPRAEGRVALKVVPPRHQQFKYHMEVMDFNVRAVSHSSKFQVIDGDRTEENWFEMSFNVYTLGLDTIFVPFTWTLVLYLMFILIMFNMGINMFTLRKRRLPRGKYPGFIALYRLLSDPSRREGRAKAHREAKELLKERSRGRDLAKDAERAPPPPQASQKMPRSPSSVPLRPVGTDDFDLELPPIRKSPKDQKVLTPLGMDKERKEGFEREVLDVLGSIDD